jgi:hypothetical protein
MKHSVQELVDIAYSYFPRGVLPNDPRYQETPEFLRQKAARVPASERYGEWRALLQRIRTRIAEQHLPKVVVESECYFLQSPTAGANMDRCYTGVVALPVRSPTETHHSLMFFVSFVVPYYVLRSEGATSLSAPKGRAGVNLQYSFDLTPDELPYARILEEEIVVTFSGYEPIPPDVGMTIIPDVGVSSRWFGEATLFHCLFADKW